MAKKTDTKMGTRHVDLEEAKNWDPDDYIGKKVMVTTMTYAYVGLCVNQNHSTLMLVNAARVYDTGQFSECLAKGSVLEAEPMPDSVVCRLNRINIVDILDWNHDLIRVVK